MAFAVVATPGVVINGAVVHQGGVSSRAMVENWLP